MTDYKLDQNFVWKAFNTENVIDAVNEINDSGAIASVRIRLGKQALFVISGGGFRRVDEGEVVVVAPWGDCLVLDEEAFEKYFEGRDNDSYKHLKTERFDAYGPRGEGVELHHDQSAPLEVDIPEGPTVAKELDKKIYENDK